MPRRSRGGQDRATQRDVQCRVPRLCGGVQERDRLVEGGCGDECVDTAERADVGGDDGFGCVGRRHVGDVDAHRAGAAFREFRCGPAEYVFPAADDRDVVPAADEPRRNGLADTGAAPGDERTLVVGRH